MQIWTKYIKKYKNFPINNVLFYDLMPAIINKRAFKNLIDEIMLKIPKNVDYIAGCDSRGFLFGPVIASMLNIGFIPIRKKGKLPGNLFFEYMITEYSNDCLTLQKDLFKNVGEKRKNLKIVLIDDLAATGATLLASIKLFQKFKPNYNIEISKILVILEIQKLKAAKLLENYNYKLDSLYKLN